ncbi:MAG: HAD hydrolase-like protein [Eubacteriales bacterium]|nr:HAD hydrolase-like protein [Eubacteriales bacterium]
MELKKLKNFIWDFDGTLYDTYPYTIDCFIKALNDTGYEADRIEIYSLMMDTIEAAFRLYEEKYGIGARLRGAFKEIRKTDPLSQGGPFPYAVDVLERVIRNGGKNYMFTHRVNDVYEFMEYWDTTKYFEDIVTLADGFEPKPSPDAINYLIQKHCFDKSETIMTGDREIDVLSGANAGIYTCHITNNMPYNDFTADLRVGNLKDMLYLLESGE